MSTLNQKRTVPMRAYFLGNFYLSPIQQGIQAAHCVHDLFIKYSALTSNATDVLYDWAANHKTMIVLNGGNSQGLADAATVMIPLAQACGYPVATFSEDEQSLNNALTCVGVVVPASIYEYQDAKREIVPSGRRPLGVHEIMLEAFRAEIGLTVEQVALSNLLASFSLAR